MRLARITAAAIAAAALALPAFAHDWYPQECCSGQDCEPIDESKITETAEGWHIKACSAIRPACIEGYRHEIGKPGVTP